MEKDDLLKDSQMGVGREKYWKELTADEKLERMRMEVKQLRNRLDAAQQTIQQSRQHVHSANEIYFRELRRGDVVEVEGPRRNLNDDEVYF